MTNHPNRSKQKSLEKIIQQIIEKDQISRIEITSRDGKCFSAKAYPAFHHPIVIQRRKRYLSGKENWSVSDAGEMIDRACNEPIEIGSGTTIEEALRYLSAAVMFRGHSP